jgi:hypothetical protein
MSEVTILKALTSARKAFDAANTPNKYPWEIPTAELTKLRDAAVELARCLGELASYHEQHSEGAHFRLATIRTGQVKALERAGEAEQELGKRLTARKVWAVIKAEDFRDRAAALKREAALAGDQQTVRDCARVIEAESFAGTGAAASAQRVAEVLLANMKR